MKTGRSTWITRTAAVIGLVGGLGGTAGATVLVAGTFPGGLTSYGEARCVVTNFGTANVLVKSVELRSSSGSVLDDSGTGWTIQPGYTLTVAMVPTDYASPSSCVFDL